MQFIHNIQEKAQGFMAPSGQTEAGHAETTTATTGHTATDGTTTSKFSSQMNQLSQNPHIAMLNNQMRGFQQRYVTGSTGPVLKGLQIAITAHKGVALDYDTVSRDTGMLHKEVSSWVTSLPSGDGATQVPGAVETGVQGGPGSLSEALPTSTLLNLTSQMSSVQKILSTRLIEARAPLKALREVEQQLDERQIRLKDMQKHAGKKGSGPEDIDMLTKEIHELSLGIGEKREEAIERTERLIWEAYGEYARHLLILSHAGTNLLDMLPAASRTQRLEARPGTVGPIAGKTLNSHPSRASRGEEAHRVRAIEEGVRRSLAGLDGAWKVSIDDEGLAGSVSGTPLHRQASRSSFINAPGSPARSVPPSIPPHVVLNDQKPNNPDIIGAYPSSQLNNSPTNLPVSPRDSMSKGTAGTSAGLLNASSGHKHRSSFDRPISPPVHIQSSHQPLVEESALKTDSPPAEDSLASHPTMAETGVPIAGHTGPASGQLERREKPQDEGIVRLNSLGGQGLESSPSQGGVPQEQLPVYGEGFAARASQPPPVEKPDAATAPQYNSQTDPQYAGGSFAPPPPQHPAVASDTVGAGNGSGLSGITPREKAHYQSQTGQ